MSQILISPVKVTAGLSTAIVVSIFLAVFLWFWVDAEPARNPYLGIEDLPSMQMASAKNIDEVLARPLFWKGRQPVLVPEEAVVEEEIVQVAPLKNIKLLGVVMTGSVHTALLEVEGKVLSVKAGQEIQNWTVQEVSSKAVSFVAGGKRTALSLVRERPDSIKLKISK